MKLFTTIFFILGLCSSSFAQGNCLDFDGEDDYVTIEGFTQAGEFTISTWFTSNIFFNFSYDEMIFNWGPNQDLGIGITYGPLSELIVYRENGSPIVYPNLNIRDGNWHHVAVVKTSNGMESIYYDGVLVDELNGNIVLNQGDVLRIGANANDLSFSSFFNGKIDETQVWSVAMTEQEIIAGMYCELNGDEENLLAYYNYNQGNAGGNNSGESVVLDQSGNNRDGALSNFSLQGSASNWIMESNDDIFSSVANIGLLDGELMVNSAAGLNYQWVDCNNNFEPIPNATGDTFSPTETGNYAVALTNNSCSYMSECVSYTLVSISEVVDAFGLSIYPNPTSDVVTVEKGTSENLDIMVYNLLGEKLLHFSADKEVSNLDLSDFNTGTYLVEVTNGKDSVIEKVVKL